MNIVDTIKLPLGGSNLDAPSISRLFSEQNTNTAASTPTGFSVNNIQGFSLLGNVSSSPRLFAPLPAATRGGLGKLLLQALAIAAFVALYFYWNNVYWNNGRKSAEKAAEGGASMAQSTAHDMTAKTGDLATPSFDGSDKILKDATGKLPSLPNADLDSIIGQVTSMLEGVTTKLGGVTNAAGAEQILPDLKDYSSKLSGLTTTVFALPLEGKSMIVELITSQIDKITPFLEKLTGSPDIGETVLAMIDQIKDKLKSILGSS